MLGLILFSFEYIAIFLKDYSIMYLEKVFNNGPIKVCRIQPLKNFHIVYSWILWLVLHIVDCIWLQDKFTGKSVEGWKHVNPFSTNVPSIYG